MPFQAIAILSGNRQKTIPNRSEEQLLSEVVLPFVANGIITAKWGKKKQSYQVLELRIFGDLENRLCEIDGDGRMLHVDSSLLWPARGRVTWHDDAASAGGIHSIACSRRRLVKS